MLVRDLLAAPEGQVISLAAIEGDALVGHVALTLSPQGALLGPLAVHPDHQRQGLGTALVDAGCSAVRDAGGGHVFLLGDPAYYSRLGFRTETQVKTPLPIPDASAPAWQSRAVVEGSVTEPSVLDVPDFWRVPSYWG